MVKDVKIEILRSDGEFFVLDGTKYFILGDGLKGLGFPDINVYSEELAFKDGSIVTGLSYSGRHIEINFMSFNTEDEERERVREFFNGKEDFILYVTYKNVTRWIGAVIEGFELPTENNYKYTKATVKFFCAKPFFNSYEDNLKYLQEKIPRWGFPFIATEDYDPVLSVYKYGDYVWFDNEGDIENAFKVILYCAGNVTNPKIYQGFRDEQKFFKLNKEFHEGDEIYIDFDTAECYVNGESSWNLVDPDSVLLSIPKEGTYISCTADIGENSLYAVVGYNSKYGGI